MTLSALLVEDVTLYRTTSETRDAVGGVTPVTTTTVVSGLLQPVDGSEDRVNRNTQLGDWRLFLGPDVDVTGWDAVVGRDRTFEIVAPPRPMLNPRTGAVSHLEVDLREVV